MDIKAGERITPETIQSLTKYFDKSNRPEKILTYKNTFRANRVTFAVSKKLSGSDCVVYVIQNKNDISTNVLALSDFIIKDANDSSLTLVKNQYTFLEGNDYYEVVKISFTTPIATDDSFYLLEISDTLFRETKIDVYVDFENNGMVIPTNQVFSSTSYIEGFRNLSSYINNQNIRHVVPNDIFTKRNTRGYDFYVIGCFNSEIKNGAYDDIILDMNDIGQLFLSRGDFEVTDNGSGSIFFKIPRETLAFVGELQYINKRWAEFIISYRTLVGSTLSDWSEIYANWVVREYLGKDIDPLLEHNWLHQEYLNYLGYWRYYFGYKNFDYRYDLINQENRIGSDNIKFSNLPLDLQNDRLFKMIGSYRYSYQSATV